MFPHCKVSPGVCLLALWFAWANGWQLLGMVLSAAAVHEIGHCLVLWCCGGHVESISVGVLGAVLKTDSGRLSYGRELLVVLAGPAANLLGAWWMGRLGWMTAAGAQLILALFNLLPLWPLDGGRILELLFSWIFGPVIGFQVLRWSGAAAALLLSGVLLDVIWETGGSLWLLPALCGTAAAGIRSFSGNMK